MRRPTPALAVLSLAVGMVLADSAIVTLALPAILREFDIDVDTVAWVLISFNLVLALAAVPAARICVRGQVRTAAVIGLIVFAASSAACAIAPSFEVLLVARIIQALGGALVIAGCLELLVEEAGSEQRGAALWAAAGVAGAAMGPVVGGLLTDLISWQSIFVVQVPIAVVALPAVWRIMPSRVKPQAPPVADRPHVAANLALALLSAALTAALFLLVLLLVEGWRKSPALAALTVTVIPVAALIAAPLARAGRAGSRAESIGGAILIAGGLTGLAILPAADPVWTVPPQMLVGVGLGLTVDSLTRVAMRERIPHTLHGGWTIAARHAGIVAGLAILTPVFTADLKAAEEPAKEAIAVEVLDSPISASSKIALANGLGDELLDERGQVPDLGAAFEEADLPDDERAAAVSLQSDLDDQLERAATDAFQTAFLLAALLALLAIVPSAMLLDVPRERR